MEDTQKKEQSHGSSPLPCSSFYSNPRSPHVGPPVLTATLVQSLVLSGISSVTQLLWVPFLCFYVLYARRARMVERYGAPTRSTSSHSLTFWSGRP